jgi:hypothetical protein
MTEPINLPPLPEARKPDEYGVGWFTAGQMHAYVEQATAELRAEVERLRAELAAMTNRARVAEETVERCKAANDATSEGWRQTQTELDEARAEVERLRAAVASHSEDVLDMVQPAPTVKKSLPVDWMKQALAAVWNFPSHPGFHLADSSADQDGEDPTSAWRAGWIAAVGAMQDAVRNVTPDPQEQAERERVETEVERLRSVLTAIVDFVDGPAEEKRPDVFGLRINAARAALKEPK